ncbi:glycosyltransferase 87 family protein [Patescibacteria group bacterium]
MKLDTLRKVLPYFLVAVIFFCALKTRLSYFDQVGNDFEVFRQAAEDFYEGVNPYYKTIETFGDRNSNYDHGFAFLPGILYLFTPLHHYHTLTNLQMVDMYKYPILAFDIGIGILFTIYFWKKSKFALIVSLLFWFFNPYIVTKTNFNYMDSVSLFFMLFALMYLEEDDILSGFFYALSFGMKTFPIILFPLFSFRSKSKLTFLLSSGITLLAVSLPFLSDPQLYLRAALLSHSERFVQGKPFLFLLSYKQKIEFIRTIPFNFYAFMAIASGWIITSLEYLKLPIQKIKNFYKRFESKYAAAVLPFIGFYILTPVLNKTYLLWVMPVLTLGAYEYFKEKKFWFYVTLGVFYLFYFRYLSEWGYGLHVDYKYY